MLLQALFRVEFLTALMTLDKLLLLLGIYSIRSEMFIDFEHSNTTPVGNREGTARIGTGPKDLLLGRFPAERKGKKQLKNRRPV